MTALAAATLFIFLGAPVVLAAAPMCNGLEATMYVNEDNMIVEDGVIIGAYNGTITGNNSGNDVIVGTTGSDIINAQNGSNTICSLNGDDTITGGNSTDWIDAGEGANFVNAKNGVNTIVTSNGNNEII
jgi:Ca2+-binding RTX toxin-like protein